MQITILTKNPGEDAVETTIDNNDSKMMRKLVGDGFFEAVPVADGIVLWCNEDGKRLGLAANLITPNDLIVGPIFFSGSRDERADVLGLTPHTPDARHIEWLDVTCPECGTKPLEGVEVDVANPRLHGGSGVGVYAYCPACEWRSTMMTRSTL